MASKNIFTTNLHNLTISKKEDTINIYLHGNSIFSATKDKDKYYTTYSAPNNRWMNENNIKISSIFNNYSHIKRELLFRLFAELPENETDNISHSNMPPARFRIVKDKIYFEVHFVNKWRKMAVILDNPLKQFPEKWNIKFYNVYNPYCLIGINHCSSTNKVIEEFLNNIHIQYFPTKLKEWMEARVLAKTMIASNDNSDSPSTSRYGVYANGKYIGNTQPSNLNSKWYINQIKI